MGRRAVAVIGVVVLSAVACGGRVIDEPDPDPPREENAPPASTSTSTPKSPTRGSGSSDDFVGSMVALPDCKKGSPPSNGDPCNFTTGGLCYETKIKACACACPRKTGTVCSSGFPNSVGSVVVSCS